MRRPANLMPKDAEALEEFTSRVRSALGVGLVELKLFGSKATGRDEVESDIDVLVVVDGAAVSCSKVLWQCEPARLGHAPEVGEIK